MGLKGQEDAVGGGVQSRDPGAPQGSCPEPGQGVTWGPICCQSPHPRRGKENKGLQRRACFESLEPVKASYQRDDPDVIKLQNLRWGDDLGEPCLIRRGPLKCWREADREVRGM